MQIPNEKGAVVIFEANIACKDPAVKADGGLAFCWVIRINVCYAIRMPKIEHVHNSDLKSLFPITFQDLFGLPLLFQILFPWTKPRESDMASLVAVLGRFSGGYGWFLHSDKECLSCWVDHREQAPGLCRINFMMC